MDVEIIRSRRRTLSLSVTENGKVVVRAPLYAGEEEITRFLSKHIRWIEKRISEQTVPSLDLSDGARVVLFGRENTVAEGRARFSGGTLFLPQEGREETLVRLLKRETVGYMGALTERIAGQYGFSYSAVRASSARGRWGSCNAQGRIAYSFRVAFLPPSLLEYLCVHELCHTRYMNHGPGFWREVQKILPDWRERRTNLKNYGGYMRLL
ncbi:MAG: M48 family metallopeptidase [Candidatus Gallimonas sp.]